MNAPRSVTDPRCELSDLPASTCGCRKHRPGVSIADVEPTSVRSYGYNLTTVLDAKYPGRCQECGDPIVFGEEITPERHGGGSVTGRWAHLECAREA